LKKAVCRPGADAAAGPIRADDKRSPCPCATAKGFVYCNIAQTAACDRAKKTDSTLTSGNIARIEYESSAYFSTLLS
jgi:hypothetical protein